MELSNILVTIGALGLALLLSLYIRKSVKQLQTYLLVSLSDRIKTLDPNKRYIISLPSSMSDTEFDEAFEVMKSHLDLESSNTHIVIMHGDVRMVEFS